MELSVAIQAKVEVTPSNWNFGFQPTLISGCFPVIFPVRSYSQVFTPRDSRKREGRLGLFLFPRRYIR